MSRVPDVRKIAVLRAQALGDYIAAVPALTALRSTYPDAEIVYLGRPWHKAFLEGRPGPVDRVVIVPPKPGVRDEPNILEDENELQAFFTRMRAEQFDLAIQMNGGGRNTNPFIQRFDARMTVGMCTPDAPPLDRWIPYLWYQNEFMRLLELVSLVGARTDNPDPQVTVTDTDYTELANQLPHLRGSYAVLHPGASDLRRRWPSERFAAVGDALAARGLDVVVTGVAAERDVVDRVIEAMQAPAIDACNCLSLGGLAALLARAEIVISNDTGPMHLADAVGVPTVGLFWCGNFGRWTHLNRRRHRPLAAWITHCPHCGANMMGDTPPDNGCAHDACFVDSIMVGEVIGAAGELLAYTEAQQVMAR